MAPNHQHHRRYAASSSARCRDDALFTNILNPSEQWQHCSAAAVNPTRKPACVREQDDGLLFTTRVPPSNPKLRFRRIFAARRVGFRESHETRGHRIDDPATVASFTAACPCASLRPILNLPVILPKMRHLDLSVLALGLLVGFASPAHSKLPYNPTTVFLPRKHNGSLAYVFSPAPSASSFQLLALNLSSTVSAVDPPFATLSTSLPFDNSGKSAFTPVMNDAGDMFVRAGDCTSGSSGSNLWRFTPDKTGINGTWVQQSIATAGPGDRGAPGAANFLSCGVPFSSGGESNASNTRLYYFGGMCPTPGSEVSTWTTSANYSNSVILLEPMPSSAVSPPSPLKYSLVVSQSKSPPIAEAGFSMTALRPTFSNSSAGIEMVQASFLLLGGHTRTAFTNMSQAALFSLPEESWSYLRLGLPASANGKSGLASRTGAVEIDSRSGHTTVLTEDGRKLIVFGGWVGDVNTPADPQLVVLEIGQGYGGVGDWMWSVPSQADTGGIKPGGLYGHGAAMLPGGVMMITGGYLTPVAHGSDMQSTNQTTNSRIYFFNTTTNTWIPSYTNPHPSKSQDEKSNGKQATGPLSTPSKKAAFGSGLALGLSAIVGAVAVGCWYSRRLKKRRDIREKELREFALGAARFHSSGLRLSGIDGRGEEKSAVDWMADTESRRVETVHPWAAGGLGSGFSDGGGGGGSGWRNSRGTDAEKTGLLVETPSPTRGPRRSMHARSRSGDRTLPYQTVPGLDDGRRDLGTPGTIHPIDERDEYEQQGHGSGEIGVGQSTDLLPNRASAGSALDLFGDLPKRAIAATSSNERSDAPGEHELENQEWARDWAVAEAAFVAGGRLSPGRSSPDKDRTRSNLSEKSIKSTSSGPPQSAISRSHSQRSSGVFMAANPFSSSNVSPTFDRSGSGSPQHRRSQSLSYYSQRPESGGHYSFPNAGPSYSQLQMEGERLLPRPSSGNYSLSPPESPTKDKGKARSSGWMGSIKRALSSSGGEKNTSLASDASA
ncbi:hypothetical protein GP486_005541, partial [Trichoglossum hirsutum]